MDTKVKKVAEISTGAIAFVIGSMAVHAWTAPAPVHDQLVEAANTAKHALPVKVDDVTTLKDERVDGKRFVYVYEVSIDSIDATTQQAKLTKLVCGNNDLRIGMIKGVSYGYEYWRNGALLSQFTVSSCA
jgi:hypothetical protein